MKRKTTVAIAILFPVMVSAMQKDLPTLSEQTGSTVVHLERPDDPPLAPAEDPAPHLRRKASVERNGYRSVQVNVDSAGFNVPADAANEPSMAVDPTAVNRLVIGWRQFDNVNSNFREAGIAWSDDGGRSWNVEESLENGVFRSDPVLEADADGHFFYNSLSTPPAGIVADFFDSEDAGRSWRGPTEAFGGDKVWVAIDRTDGIGRGNIYQSWSLAGNIWDEAVFSRSTDGGESFSFPQEIWPAPIWGTLVVGPDGELYLGGNAAFQRNLFVVHRSLDAQDPDVAEPTFDVFLAPLGGSQGTGDGTFETPNPAGLLGQVWLAVDPSDGPRRGFLYMVSSVDPQGSDPQDVHFIRSEDRGRTWSHTVRVNTDDRDAWQWFATMSVAPNGRIDVVWVESLDGNQSNIGELIYTFSEDGGLTWGDERAVSPTFDSHLGFPRQDKIGDYYHMRSDLVGADLAYAATFNGEQDVFYLRIGDRDCNGNGIGDNDDLESGNVADCDRNGIPDSCEIAAKPHLDLDGNLRLDACEAPRKPTGRAG